MDDSDVQSDSQLDDFEHNILINSGLGPRKPTTDSLQGLQPRTAPLNPSKLRASTNSLGTKAQPKSLLGQSRNTGQFISSVKATSIVPGLIPPHMAQPPASSHNTSNNNNTRTSSSVSSSNRTTNNRQQSHDNRRKSYNAPLHGDDGLSGGIQFDTFDGGSDMGMNERRKTILPSIDTDTDDDGTSATLGTTTVLFPQHTSRFLTKKPLNDAKRDSIQSTAPTTNTTLGSTTTTTTSTTAAGSSSYKSLKDLSLDDDDDDIDAQNKRKVSLDFNTMPARRVVDGQSSPLPFSLTNHTNLHSYQQSSPTATSPTSPSNALDDGKFNIFAPFSEKFNENYRSSLGSKGGGQLDDIDVNETTDTDFEETYGAAFDPKKPITAKVRKKPLRRTTIGPNSTLDDDNDTNNINDNTYDSSTINNTPAKTTNSLTNHNKAKPTTANAPNQRHSTTTTTRNNDYVHNRNHSGDFSNSDTTTSNKKQRLNDSSLPHLNQIVSLGHNDQNNNQNTASFITPMKGNNSFDHNNNNYNDNTFIGFSESETENNFTPISTHRGTKNTHTNPTHSNQTHNTQLKSSNRRGFALLPLINNKNESIKVYDVDPSCIDPVILNNSINTTHYHDQQHELMSSNNLLHKLSADCKEKQSFINRNHHILLHAEKQYQSKADSDVSIKNRLNRHQNTRRKDQIDTTLIESIHENNQNNYQTTIQHALPILYLDPTIGPIPSTNPNEYITNEHVVKCDKNGKQLKPTFQLNTKMAPKQTTKTTTTTSSTSRRGIAPNTSSNTGNKLGAMYIGTGIGLNIQKIRFSNKQNTHTVNPSGYQTDLDTTPQQRFYSKIRQLSSNDTKLRLYLQKQSKKIKSIVEKKYKRINTKQITKPSSIQQMTTDRTFNMSYLDRLVLQNQHVDQFVKDQHNQSIITTNTNVQNDHIDTTSVHPTIPMLPFGLNMTHIQDIVINGGNGDVNTDTYATDFMSNDDCDAQILFNKIAKGQDKDIDITTTSSSRKALITPAKGNHGKTDKGDKLTTVKKTVKKIDTETTTHSVPIQRADPLSTLELNALRTLKLKQIEKKVKNEKNLFAKKLFQKNLYIALIQKYYRQHIYSQRLLSRLTKDTTTTIDVSDEADTKSMKSNEKTSVGGKQQTNSKQPKQKGILAAFGKGTANTSDSSTKNSTSTNASLFDILDNEDGLDHVKDGEASFHINNLKNKKLNDEQKNNSHAYPQHGFQITAISRIRGANGDNLNMGYNGTDANKAKFLLESAQSNPTISTNLPDFHVNSFAMDDTEAIFELERLMEGMDAKEQIDFLEQHGETQFSLSNVINIVQSRKCEVDINPLDRDVIDIDGNCIDNDTNITKRVKGNTKNDKKVKDQSAFAHTGNDDTNYELYPLDSNTIPRLDANKKATSIRSNTKKKLHKLKSARPTQVINDTQISFNTQYTSGNIIYSNSSLPNLGFCENYHNNNATLQSNFDPMKDMTTSYQQGNIKSNVNNTTYSNLYDLDKNDPSMSNQLPNPQISNPINSIHHTNTNIHFDGTANDIKNIDKFVQPIHNTNLSYDTLTNFSTELHNVHNVIQTTAKLNDIDKYSKKDSTQRHLTSPLKKFKGTETGNNTNKNMNQVNYNNDPTNNAIPINPFITPQTIEETYTTTIPPPSSKAYATGYNPIYLQSTQYPQILIDLPLNLRSLLPSSHIASFTLDPPTLVMEFVVSSSQSDDDQNKLALVLEDNRENVTGSKIKTTRKKTTTKVLPPPPLLTPSQNTKTIHTTTYYIMFHGYVATTTPILPMNTTHIDSYFITQQKPIPVVKFTSFTIHQDILPSIQRTKHCLFLSYLYHIILLSEYKYKRLINQNIAIVIQQYRDYQLSKKRTNINAMIDDIDDSSQEQTRDDTNTNSHDADSYSDDINSDDDDDDNNDEIISLMDDKFMTMIMSLLLNGIEPYITGIAMDLDHNQLLFDLAHDTVTGSHTKSSNNDQNKPNKIQNNIDNILTTLHGFTPALPIQPIEQLPVPIQRPFTKQLPNQNFEKKMSVDDYINLIKQIAQLKSFQERQELIKLHYNLGMIPQSIQQLPPVLQRLNGLGMLPKEYAHFIGKTHEY